MMQRFYIISAVIFAVGFVAIWFVFLRPVSVQTATGTVRSKTFRESGTYWQGHHGLNRGFRTPTPIEIAEAYIVEVDVPGRSEPLRYAATMREGEALEIDEAVRVEYQTVGVPPFWTRSYVVALSSDP